MKSKIALHVSPLFFGLFAWVLMHEQKGVAAGCLAASLMHECGHLLMMFCCKAPPRTIAVGLFGMRITRDAVLTQTYMDDFWIALGGPLVNVLSCVLFYFLKKEQAFWIHAVIAGLNLLPITPLDGGQIILAILCQKVSREKAVHAMCIVSCAVLFPLGVLAFLIVLQNPHNLSLLMVELYLILLMIFKR